jgi:glutathione S-transferase
MITLYHSPFSVASQKVRMALAEKNLDWDDRIIDLLAGEHLDGAFRRLNPRAEVPVLEHEGHLLVESASINEYLEDRFPEIPLLPRNPLDRYRARHWDNWIARCLHAASGVITYAVLARPLILQQPTETIEHLLRSLPEPSTRVWRRNVLDLGLKAPEVKEAIVRYREFFNLLESDLAGPHSWLCGGAFSLADIAVLPYVMRAEHVGLGDLMTFEEYPNTRSWYLRMLTRPSMQSAFVRYFDGDTQELVMDLVVAAQPKIYELIQQTTLMTENHYGQLQSV